MTEERSPKPSRRGKRPLIELDRGWDLPMRGSLSDVDVRECDLELAKVELVYSASGPGGGRTTITCA